MTRLRTLLILGRVSNLPTVWSNCLAGWWLGGGMKYSQLPWLLAGISLLYLGGMFLNDAFDADFDREHRKERPIPAGAIPLKIVWRLGLIWLTAGLLCVARFGITAALWGTLLVICIVVYDAVHKLTAFAAVLMGLCRALVYITAASAATGEVNGHVVWCGTVLMLYVLGLTLAARGENAGGTAYWPFTLLAAPVILAMFLNAGEFRKTAVLLSIALTVWTIRSLADAFLPAVPRMKNTISGLLAGVVLVDLLAAADLMVRADAPWQLIAAFPCLFVLALLLQRFVPAT